MRKPHAFQPALDGRLEDRLVLSAGQIGRAAAMVARTAAIRPMQTTAVQATQFTTLRYYNITINIHNAVQNYGNSNGSEAAFNRLLNRVYNQVRYIPYAVQGGLVSTIRGDITGATPADKEAIYSIIRSDVLDHISTQVADGSMVVVKSKGPSHWTDSEIYGPNAVI